MTSLRRCLQRLSIIVLSLMAILAITIPGAQADDTAGTATITITKPHGFSNSLDGMTVTAYQVFKQIGTTTGEEGLYTVTSDFKDFFNLENTNGSGGEDTGVGSLFKTGDDEEVSLGYDTSANHLVEYKENESNILGPVVVENGPLDTSNGEAELLSRIQPSGTGTNNSDIATFYTWVERYIEAKVKAGDTWNSNPTTVNVATNEGSITIDNLDPGYYALMFSGVPDGISVKQGILVAAKSGEPSEVNLKAENLPLEKKVKNPSHDKDYNENTTASIGDILDYRITSRIPTLTDTDNLQVFELSDTLHNQKLVQNSTVTLTLSNTDKTTTITFSGVIPPDAGEQKGAVNLTQSKPQVNPAQTIATLTINPYNTADKTQTFTVNFLGDNSLWSQYQGYDITLTYHAVLTADAVRANDNDVTLDINNNGDDTELTDKTTVYTYGIEVQKKFSDNSETYTGVTFQLCTDKECQTPIKLSGSAGAYKVEKVPGSEGNIGGTNLKLSDNGTLTITGLGLGTYWLVETAAPGGFTKADPIQIVLADGDSNTNKPKDGTLDLNENKETGPTTARINSDGTNLVTGIGVSGTDTVAITLAKFEVLNQKGFNLPQTGAAGVWLCVAGGLVLIAVAGVLFVASRGRRNVGSDSRA